MKDDVVTTCTIKFPTLDQWLWQHNTIQHVKKHNEAARERAKKTGREPKLMSFHELEREHRFGEPWHVVEVPMEWVE